MRTVTRDRKRKEGKSKRSPSSQESEISSSSHPVPKEKVKTLCCGGIRTCIAQEKKSALSVELLTGVLEDFCSKDSRVREPHL